MTQNTCGSITPKISSLRSTKRVTSTTGKWNGKKTPTNVLIKGIFSWHIHRALKGHKTSLLVEKLCTAANSAKRPFLT